MSSVVTEATTCYSELVLYILDVGWDVWMLPIFLPINSVQCTPIAFHSSYITWYGKINPVAYYPVCWIANTNICIRSNARFHMHNTRSIRFIYPPPAMLQPQIRTSSVALSGSSTILLSLKREGEKKRRSVSNIKHKEQNSRGHSCVLVCFTGDVSYRAAHSLRRCWTQKRNTWHQLNILKSMQYVIVVYVWRRKIGSQLTVFTYPVNILHIVHWTTCLSHSWRLSNEVGPGKHGIVAKFEFKPIVWVYLPFE